jgi:hypothetical protein
MRLDLISSASLLCPLVLGLINVNHNNKHQKLFLLFIIFSTLFEIASTTLVLYGIDNRWMFRLFLICDFLFFSWFFNKFVQFSRWFNVINLILFLYIIVDCISLILPYFIFTEVVFFTLVFLFFIVQSMLVIVSLISEERIMSNPIFWISTAHLFYYLAIFSIYIYSYLFVNSFDDRLFVVAYNIINATGNILCNLMFGISFLCKKNHS